MWSETYEKFSPLGTTCFVASSVSAISIISSCSTAVVFLVVLVILVLDGDDDNDDNEHVLFTVAVSVVAAATVCRYAAIVPVAVKQFYEYHYQL